MIYKYMRVISSGTILKVQIWPDNHSSMRIWDGINWYHASAFEEIQLLKRRLP
jgi:hypothetical protein